MDRISMETLPAKFVCWGKGLCRERQGTIEPSIEPPALARSRNVANYIKKG